jgi:hypothetical protein
MHFVEHPAGQLYIYIYITPFLSGGAHELVAINVCLFFLTYGSSLRARAAPHTGTNYKTSI